MKPVILLLIAIVTLNLFAQENPNTKYPLEYDWQKKIAEKKQKNIKDYFLLIPSCFFGEMAQFGEYSTIEKREKIIIKEDIRNGYIQYHGSAQLVLFKDRKNKIDIIAIQTNGCGAGTNSMALNTLLEFKDNQWRFRIDLLPDGKMIEDLYYSDDSCPWFDLPQFGTTILVKDELKDEKIIAEYKWMGHRFIKSNDPKKK